MILKQSKEVTINISVFVRKLIIMKLFILTVKIVRNFIGTIKSLLI